jgi:uncharacterized protein YjiS (DUF1127 family)
MCGSLATINSKTQRTKKMTTKNVKANAAADHMPADWRDLDPVNVMNLARQQRSAMIAEYLGDAWKRATAAIAKRFRARAVYQELSELPDYLLNDIGIRRDQLSAIAYGGLNRQASDLEIAAGKRPLGFVERKPAVVVAARQDNAPGDHKPLAA